MVVALATPPPPAVDVASTSAVSTPSTVTAPPAVTAVPTMLASTLPVREAVPLIAGANVITPAPPADNVASTVAVWVACTVIAPDAWSVPPRTSAWMSLLIPAVALNDVAVNAPPPPPSPVAVAVWVAVAMTSTVPAVACTELAAVPTRGPMKASTSESTVAFADPPAPPSRLTWAATTFAVALSVPVAATRTDAAVTVAPAPIDARVPIGSAPVGATDAVAKNALTEMPPALPPWASAVAVAVPTALDEDRASNGDDGAGADERVQAAAHPRRRAAADARGETGAADRGVGAGDADGAGGGDARDLDGQRAGLHSRPVAHEGAGRAVGEGLHREPTDAERGDHDARRVGGDLLVHTGTDEHGTSDDDLPRVRRRVGAEGGAEPSLGQAHRPRQGLTADAAGEAGGRGHGLDPHDRGRQRLDRQRRRLHRGVGADGRQGVAAVDRVGVRHDDGRHRSRRRPGRCPWSACSTSPARPSRPSS